jgi:hypothetical protein
VVGSLGRRPDSLVAMPQTSASSSGAKRCGLLAPFLLTAIVVSSRSLSHEPPGASMRVVPVSIARESERGFRTLSGAGASLALRIRAYRDLVDPGLGTDDLRRVPGVGSQRLHLWAPWLTSGERP